MASLNIMAHILCSVWIFWRMFNGQSEYHGTCSMVGEEERVVLILALLSWGWGVGGYNGKDPGGYDGKDVGG